MGAAVSLVERGCRYFPNWEIVIVEVIGSDWGSDSGRDSWRDSGSDRGRDPGRDSHREAWE